MYRHLLQLITFLLVLCTVLSDNLDEGPRVCIQDGCFLGKHFTTLRSKQFEAFLGVPYAKAPVGALRFKNPQPVEPWQGNYDATFERSVCVQKNDLFPNQPVEGSEDCLYINLYKPVGNDNDSTPLPVMVFIHGGGYFSGSASKGLYGPDRFMDSGKVLLVVMQYRLGVFGFFSTDDQAATGNFGLKDQTAVLRWVQKNIAQFGGDPKSVTIFGQSAGGASTQFHMVSPLSRGLFSQVITMSGSMLGFWNSKRESLLKFAQRQAAVVGINSPESMTSQQLVEALRQVDAVKLAESIDKLKFYHVYPITSYHPTVEKYVDDGTFISEDPHKLWKQLDNHQLPLTIGYVPNEGAFGSLGILTNQTLLDLLNENSRDFIPRIFGIQSTEKTRTMLRERFFPGGTEDRWITEANKDGLERLFSESFILFPTVLSVQQRFALDSSLRDTTSGYYFSYRGRNSYSKYFGNTDKDYGVCHSDDLIYLFRSKDLFEDFEVEGKDQQMADSLIEYYTTFASKGPIPVFGTSKNVKLFPADQVPSELFPDEVSNFWTELYKE